MTAAEVEVLAGEVVAAGQTPQLDRLRAGWLLTKSPNTRAAYASDFDLWEAFCDEYGVDPISPTKTHVEAWHRQMAVTPTARTGKPAGQATLARRVSALASWFAYLLDEDVIDAVPIRKSTRPRAPKESPTIGLSVAEGEAIDARCVEHESVRDAAVILTLRYAALRVGELVGLDVGDVQPEEGHEAVFRVRGKGNKVRKVPAARPVVDALGRYLEWRCAGEGIALADLDDEAPLFVTAGGGRFTQRSVMRMVQRVARAAGVASWARLSPHSLRHAFATQALDGGAGLDEVQDVLGHANADTTRRYDRARGRLSRTSRAVNAVAALVARQRESRERQ